MQQRSLMLTVIASSLLLPSCGGLSSLSGQSAESERTAKANANLTDAAADETASADATASATDAGSDQADTQTTADLPAFLQVVEAARDYTRQLLGLSDAPLQDFKAAVAAAEALATDQADFKAKIAPAKTALDAALAAQAKAADQARTDHAAELQAIFDGTVAVFKACGTSVELNPHGGGQGPATGGPVLVIGSGVFNGSLGDMHQKANDRPGCGPQGGRRPGEPGQRFGLDDATVSDPAVSDECTTASAALQALLPAGS